MLQFDLVSRDSVLEADYLLRGAFISYIVSSISFEKKQLESQILIFSLFDYLDACKALSERRVQSSTDSDECAVSYLCLIKPDYHGWNFDVFSGNRNPENISSLSNYLK